MANLHSITISLPPSVLQKVERLRKLEKRSRSKLIGEALERYFSIRVVRASKPDLSAMRRGRAEIKAGKFVTLESALDALDTPDRKPRGRRTSKNSR